MSSLLDLIETLWNVKTVHLDSFVLRDFGFNRDIVECKGIRNSIPGHCFTDLIETLWNVKRYNITL